MSLPGAREQFLLDPKISFLNHGSFGACPRPVLEAQSAWRAQMETHPVDFLDRRLPGLLAEARARTGAFIDADPAGLAFVPNATTAVNTVVKGIGLKPGEEVVLTDHVYPAVLNTVERTCASLGARVSIAKVPLPLPSDEEIARAVLGMMNENTRLVVIDHVTSPTGAIFPVQEVIKQCRARGVLCMIDGAHAPGMLTVSVSKLDPDFWTGNFHKWVCAPKGAAVLFVAEQHRETLRPLVTSHAHLEGFHAVFDWLGTYDPTPYLTIPAAISFMNQYGWNDVRAHNDRLAHDARALIADAIGSPLLIPEDRFASMALIALPPKIGTTLRDAVRETAELYSRARIEVPFVPWNGAGFVRISAQIYNEMAEYERLADALTTMKP